VNPPFDKDRYQIAVKLDPQGKGGSKEMHEQIAEGDVLEISHPKNHFVLYEKAPKFILIGGGIGLTPLLSMAHRLTEIERPFELHVCAKSPDEVPFQYELENWTFAPNVEIHLDKNGRSSMDIDLVLAEPDGETLLYICGPAGFNKWVKGNALAMGWKADHIKQEVFTNDQMEWADPQTFQIELQKSGQTLTVEKDQTIIDALHMQDIQVPYSCMQGTCGTCLTKVVEGEIEHRDIVLNHEEKKAQDQMCLCVSRSKGGKLILDL
jgi:vanillate O-demethylase ferredoxin subunit